MNPAFTIAAVLAAAAALVHAGAAGTHSDQTTLAWAFALVALLQLTWAALIATRPSRGAARAGMALHWSAATAWVVTRFVDVANFESLSGPVDRMGLAATALGVAAGTLVAIPRAFAGLALIGLRVPVAAAATVAILGLTATHDHGAAAEAIPVEDAGSISARMPYTEARALLALSARAPLGSGHGAHGHAGHDHGGHGDPFEGPLEPGPLSDAERRERDAQLQLATEAANRFATIDDAVEAGYVQSSTDGPGVGAHWVKWSLVDRGFDPALPSMLLFSEVSRGLEPRLVGLSYFVASDGPPEGFAGADDQWHSHRGMCFVNGWLLGENLEERSECSDVWIDGADLWMLHVWVAHGYDNPWGVFAAVNPKLCFDRPQMPDAISCDPSGR